MENAIDMTIDEVLAIYKDKHGSFDEDLIRRAYELAEKILEGSTRDNGEKTIRHALREAGMIAGWGMGKDLLISSLLHCAVEEERIGIDDIGIKFGFDVARIVDEVSSMGDARTIDSVNSGYYSGNTDLPLISDVDNAIYVKTADRIDTLRTCVEDRLLMASITRRMFLPRLYDLHAYRFIDILEECCFLIEHPSMYYEMMELYDEILRINERSCFDARMLLTGLFDPSSDIGTEELDDYRRYIVDFIFDRRTATSLYRQFSGKADNIRNDWRSMFTKENVPLYDLTLVVDDALSQEISKIGPNDVFFELFENYLSKKDFYITRHEYTTRKDADYFLIADETDNLYRLFVRTGKEYERFLFGDIIDEEGFVFRSKKTELQQPENRTYKIKVFREDGTALMITNGATVLDFAFHIGADTGLHFDYAKINESDSRVGRNVHLNEGDTVTIVTDKNIKPDITWFKSARTGVATQYLVNYFSNRENLMSLL